MPVAARRRRRQRSTCLLRRGGMIPKREGRHHAPFSNSDRRISLGWSAPEK